MTEPNSRQEALLEYILALWGGRGDAIDCAWEGIPADIRAWLKDRDNHTWRRPENGIENCPACACFEYHIPGAEDIDA